MSQKNTLTIGGAGAGGVTALQVGQDLALLTVEGLCALDALGGGPAGCQVSLEIYEAGLRVAAVLWGVAITIAAAAIGRFIARFVEAELK